MKLRTPIRPVVTIERRYTIYPAALFVLCMVAVYLLFSRHDALQEASYWAAKHERDFTDCLKGKWRHTTEDGTEWGCMEVQSNKPRRAK